jgi:DNA-binding response OmpR family regulator
MYSCWIISFVKAGVMMSDVSSTTQSANILVVDDEGANRYSVKKTLQKVGYTVREAGSGEEALSIMAEQAFDVVLTDIRMPGLDGVELLRRIKDESPDIIVILMTAFASLGTAVEALRLGAHDYLIKPSSSQDIRQSVARGVERAQNLRRRRALLDAIRSDVHELVLSGVDLTSALGDGQMVHSSDSPSTENTPANSGNRSTDQMPATMQLGPLMVYPGRYQVTVDEQDVGLTPTEFDLLLYLAAHRGRVVSCNELVHEVRGYSVEESEAREVIRPHISNLRRKLKAARKDADLIVNVRGIGYRLNEQASK